MHLSALWLQMLSGAGRTLETTLLIIAIILILCLIASRCSDRFGMPALLLFLCLGMLFGSEGVVKIPFDNYDLANRVCSIALAFIMFYGGFGTKWETARPVAGKAVLLSTVGVVLTAFFTCAFCHWVWGMDAGESFLIGAVISSTDAASVFSILRSKQLNLKQGTAPLLEIESGSNDPFAYMLTTVGLSIVTGSGTNLPYLIFAQLVYGTVLGVLIALAARWVLQKNGWIPEGLQSVFLLAVVLLAYALPEWVGGNGYLGVYLAGIILGNSEIRNKRELVPFFDGVTHLSQIAIFFLLGLLSFPHKLVAAALPSLGIFAFLLLIARPLVMLLLLKPFGASIRQCGLVAFAGLRGAASIVFSIMVMTSQAVFQHDVYHIIFVVAFLSVAVQGTLLPVVAWQLQMIDEKEAVAKTFTDYQDSADLTLMEMYIPAGHNWENRTIAQVSMPTGALALMIKRNGTSIMPRGDTVILAEDILVLNVPSYRGHDRERLREILIESGHPWEGQPVEALTMPSNTMLVLIQRGAENIIPRGQTVLLEGDLVIVQTLPKEKGGTGKAAKQGNKQENKLVNKQENKQEKA